MSIEYAVGLQGHAFDLEGLRNAFLTGPVQVRRIEVPNSGAITALLADEFNSRASGAEVQDTAQRIVARLNGALLAADPDRSVVRMGAIYARSQGGAWGAGTAYASIVAMQGNAGIRATAAVVDPDGVPKPEEEKKPRLSLWLALADSDGADPNPIVDVLHALAGDPDWFDLWRVYELVCGDQHVLRWPRDQIEWFKPSATLYRHSASSTQGRKAKRWLVENGRPEMHLNEARRLITSIAGAWLDWKAARLLGP